MPFASIPGWMPDPLQDLRMTLVEYQSTLESERFIGKADVHILNWNPLFSLEMYEGRRLA